jgi:hypothetical protein
MCVKGLFETAGELDKPRAGVTGWERAAGAGGTGRAERAAVVVGRRDGVDGTAGKTAGCVKEEPGGGPMRSSVFLAAVASFIVRSRR